MATRTIAFRLNDKNREDKEIMEWLVKRSMRVNIMIL